MILVLCQINFHMNYDSMSKYKVIPTDMCDVIKQSVISSKYWETHLYHQVLYMPVLFWVTFVCKMSESTGKFMTALGDDDKKLLGSCS